MIGVLEEALFLYAADGLAGELGGEEVGFRCDAAGAGEQVVQGLTGLNAAFGDANSLRGPGW